MGGFKLTVSKRQFFLSLKPHHLLDKLNWSLNHGAAQKAIHENKYLSTCRCSCAAVLMTFLSRPRGCNAGTRPPATPCSSPQSVCPFVLGISLSSSSAINLLPFNETHPFACRQTAQGSGTVVTSPGEFVIIEFVLMNAFPG